MCEEWRWRILQCWRPWRVLGSILEATSADGTGEIQSRRFAWGSLNYLAPVVHARLEAGGNMSGIIQRSEITVVTGISAQLTQNKMLHLVLRMM